MSWKSLPAVEIEMEDEREWVGMSREQDVIFSVWRKTIFSFTDWPVKQEISCAWLGILSKTISFGVEN